MYSMNIFYIIGYVIAFSLLILIFWLHRGNKKKVKVEEVIPVKEVKAEVFGNVEIIRRIKQGTREIRQRATIFKNNKRTAWVRLFNGHIIIRKLKDIIGG